MFFSKYILILFLISLISTENKIFKCKTQDTQKELKIGDEVTLCLHIPEIGKKAAFKIEVDEYSVISIKEGFNKIVRPEESTSPGTDQPVEEGDKIVRNLLEENEEEEETSDEEVIKKEFIAQIGNVRTKFPTVSL